MWYLLLVSLIVPPKNDALITYRQSLGSQQTACPHSLRMERKIKKNIIVINRLALLIYACTPGATVTVSHLTFSSRTTSFQDRIYEKQTIHHTLNSHGVICLHA
jgi:hypothetical protein